MKTPLVSVPPPAARQSIPRLTLALADERDRQRIYAARHEVYAHELGQHQPQPTGALTDRLDAFNIYLVARAGDAVAGFISITPPGHGRYSIDKYVHRSDLPFPVDDRLYEVRLLTVLKPHRGGEVATLLMYAAFRWVEAHGGTRVVAIGRREVVDMYLRSGLQRVGMTFHSGAVTYDLLQAPTAALRARAEAYGGLLDRLESSTRWDLSFPFRRSPNCFHGGEFFQAIGPGFDSLERRNQIVNADVLDAWFPPAPAVERALQECLPWLLRTSPPTHCEGLITAIARARGVAPDNILPGAGSSDLIFRALRHWLTRESHVLILDPTYGEYAHVLEQVIGCTVDRLTLSPVDDYKVDLPRLEAALADRYDLVVLVNPNSPTGSYVPRSDLEKLLQQVPAGTRVWADETYVEYLGPGQSLEQFAARSEQVIVCKSMSKVYALSGARVAYLCAGAHQLEALRSITPPWVVSLPAQLAGVRALENPGYYAERYAETTVLRQELATSLANLGLKLYPGVANFLLGELPADGPDAATVIKTCREEGVFLRHGGSMGTQCGPRTVRIAVKDRAGNAKVLAALAQVLTCNRS